MKTSKLEAQFDFLLNLLAKDIEKPVCEFMFAKELGRQWRFDRCWPTEKVSVELEGGIYSGGRHVRGKGFEGDCEKYNAALTLGWAVLRYSGGMMKKNPELMFEQIRTCLNQRRK